MMRQQQQCSDREWRPQLWWSLFHQQWVQCTAQWPPNAALGTISHSNTITIANVNTNTNNNNSSVASFPPPVQFSPVQWPPALLLVLVLVTWYLLFETGIGTGIGNSHPPPVQCSGPQPNPALGTIQHSSILSNSIWIQNWISFAQNKPIKTNKKEHLQKSP